METAIMLWIHRHANPTLDAVSLLSWLLGSMWFCVSLTLLAMAWHLRRGQRRDAMAWLVLTSLAATLPELVKAFVGRPRPTLWPWLLPTFESSFPSGHSVAGAAIYPFLGWMLLRSRHEGGIGYALGFVIAVFIGLGRMYVGVHWPSDVLAGWVLGGALSGAVIVRLTFDSPLA